MASTPAKDLQLFSKKPRARDVAETTLRLAELMQAVHEKIQKSQGRK